MTRFIQVHLLTAYPPANLNRDDQGRPKTAKMGGVDRLRVSSQSLKRAWRTSEIFDSYISRKGKRTRDIGLYAKEQLVSYEKLSNEDRTNIALNIARCFGKPKAGEIALETAVFVSDKEFENINNVLRGFENGIDEASTPVQDLGFHLLKLFAGSAFEQTEQLAQEISSKNSGKLSLKKPTDLKKVIKEYRDKVKDKNDDVERAEAMLSAIQKEVDIFLTNASGSNEYTDSQLTCLFLDDFEKLAKDTAKHFDALNTKKMAENVPYGELKHKSEIKLAKDWKDLLVSWHEKVRNSDEIDIASDEAKSLLEQYISPAAIAKESILDHEDTNADIAMFGRMLASSPKYNVEAACQVAHSISVHPVVIEDDYFTAVEELNYREDAGAAHIGETGFAAGLFYSYLCINRQQLVDNLNGNESLANKAITALIEAAVKIPPSGKQNSFAHQGYASYVLAEVGNQQPRSLSVSYLKPIEIRGIVEQDYLTQAVTAIRDQYKAFDTVYGDCADKRYELNVSERKGTLPTLLSFVAGQGEGNIKSEQAGSKEE